MKTKISITLVLIGVAITLNAQTYHPFPTNSASWKVVRCYYFYQPGWHDEYTFTMNGTDTILNGVSFKKFFISNHHLPGTVNDTTYPTEFYGGFREYNKQIYMWKSWGVPDTTVKLLYDFNHTNIGDTIFTNALTGNPDQFGHLIISKDSVLAGTQFHTRLHLQDPNNVNNTEDWIEGIGSSWGFPFATFWSASDNSYDLSCFYREGNLMYGNPSPVYNFCQAPLPNIICDSVISCVSEKISENMLVSLCPNPATNNIQLSIPNSNYKNLKLIIYNTLGMLIRKEELNQNRQINIEDLTNGVYFIIISGNNSSVAKFFIKN